MIMKYKILFILSLTTLTTMQASAVRELDDQPNEVLMMIAKEACKQGSANALLNTNQHLRALCNDESVKSVIRENRPNIKENQDKSRMEEIERKREEHRNNPIPNDQIW